MDGCALCFVASSGLFADGKYQGVSLWTTCVWNQPVELPSDCQDIGIHHNREVHIWSQVAVSERVRTALAGRMMHFDVDTMLQYVLDEGPRQMVLPQRHPSRIRIVGLRSDGFDKEHEAILDSYWLVGVDTSLVDVTVDVDASLLPVCLPSIPGDATDSDGDAGDAGDADDFLAVAAKLVTHKGNKGKDESKDKGRDKTKLAESAVSAADVMMQLIYEQALDGADEQAVEALHDLFKDVVAAASKKRARAVDKKDFAPDPLMMMSA